MGREPLRQNVRGAGCRVTPKNEPVTLQLSIPSDFQKVTFHQEFFGRSFSDSRRDARHQHSLGTWQTRSEVHLLHPQHAATTDSGNEPWTCPRTNCACASPRRHPTEVSCNLEQQGTTQRAGYSEVLFASGPNPLPAHHVVRLELGKLPVPWTSYGKWVAALLLIALIVCGALPAAGAPCDHNAAPATEPIPDSSPAHDLRETPRTGKRSGTKTLRRAA